MSGRTVAVAEICLMIVKQWSALFLSEHVSKKLFVFYLQWSNASASKGQRTMIPGDILSPHHILSLNRLPANELSNLS